MALLSTAPLLHLIIILTCLFSDHVQPLCHTDESTALLEFKDSFVIRRNASAVPLAYPKVASWSPKGKDDCCSWDGIECDENNTHVIALHLSSSCLFGSINSNNSLFRLSHLQILDLFDNDFNHSQIPPQLCHLSNLRYLDLSSSAFVGQIPLEISHLSNLSHLDLSGNYYLELKQPDLSALVRNFSKLKHLGLNHVNIYSPVPRLLSNFSSITSLRLRSCGLYGKFPNEIFQLPNLQYLNLIENKNLTGSLPEFHPNNPLKELWLRQTALSGHIPSSIGNLDSLNVLSLARCRFSGPFPSSLGRLSKLPSLNVNSNNLSGTLDFNMFLNMKNLDRLLVSNNKLSVIIERSTLWNINATVPKFEVLNLASCNLTSFPDFLRYQDRLKILDLSKNHIQGKVPEWIWNTSIEALFMDSNLFTGFGVVVLPSRTLRILQLRHNNLTGPLPIPPPSITIFEVSHNELSGEISPLLLNLSSLKHLDLSHNKLSGVLPECFKNIKHSLSSGEDPQMCPLQSRLQVMDLSHNQFQGRLPRSLLANCKQLKVLKLENNYFNDVFPSWLGTLPQLKLLVLRANHFHGAITAKSSSDYVFPSLQIIDLSHNNISGMLPSNYFQNWNAMKDFDARKSSYLGTWINLTVAEAFYQYFYPFSVTITNKGRNMEYGRILEVFTVIDLSSNKFEGDIPEDIGSLRGVQVFNLSDNVLDGNIPTSLSKITQLESLDLSLNKLSGKIPQQLMQLTFLAFFNVSYNRLSGLVPQGNQLSTFDSSSYEGNAGLWGFPRLSTHRLPPSASTSDDEEGRLSESWFKLHWNTIVPGFVGGLIFGVAMEKVLAIDRQIWFVKALNFVAVTKTKG